MQIATSREQTPVSSGGRVLGMAAAISREGSVIRFEAEVVSVEGRRIVRLPADASTQLPSRGQVAAEGTVDGREFTAVIEPDGLRGHWIDITPMARWEWVRWITSTRSPATRARRVEVGISKLDRGSRRPCCFDLASCTDPDLSRSGKLVPTP